MPRLMSKVAFLGLSPLLQWPFSNLYHVSSPFGSYLLACGILRQCVGFELSESKGHWDLLAAG